MTTAIRLRGLKRFSPDSVAGLMGWWDFSDASKLYTDDGTTLVSADADLIYHAKDKSATGATMLQSTSANRPAYKVNIQNGRSVARFGTSDSMSTSNATLLSAFTGTDLPLTLFIACKDSTSGGFTEVFRIGTTGTPYWQFLYRLTNPIYYLDKKDDGGTSKLMLADNGTGTSGVFRTVIWRDTGTVGTIYQNSTLVTTGTKDLDLGALTPAGTVRIGAASGGGLDLIGDVGEILLYDAALSDADRGSVQAYLAARWGL